MVIGVLPKEIIAMGGYLQGQTCVHSVFTTGGLPFSAYNPTYGCDTQYGHSNGVVVDAFLRPVCSDVAGRQVCVKEIRAETFGSEYFGVNRETTTFEMRVSVNDGKNVGEYTLVQQRKTTFVDNDRMFQMETDAGLWEFQRGDDVRWESGRAAAVSAETLVGLRERFSADIRQLVVGPLQSKTGKVCSAS